MQTVKTRSASSGKERDTTMRVTFDVHLNFLEVNEATCEHLKKEPADLVGKSILDLYPGMIASRNHRNLLKALSGATIKDTVVSNVYDIELEATYTPVLSGNRVTGVSVTAKPQAASS